MARPREDFNKDHFDLLPFIAILMCTLGCLLLVTMSMAAISLGNPGEGWIKEKDSNQNSIEGIDEISSKHPKNQPKIPILAEWDGKQAIFHLEGQKVSIEWSEPSCFLYNTGDRVIPVFIKDRQISSEFQSILDKLKAQSNTHYVLLAIRPSGFESFMNFSDEFRCREISIGYEPIAQDRSVRLLQSESQP